MRALSFLAGVELLLLVTVVSRLRENRRLCDELRKCHADLAAALAHVAKDEILPRVSTRRISQRGSQRADLLWQGL